MVELALCHARRGSALSALPRDVLNCIMVRCARRRPLF
jgi:hypothetical protein